MDKETAVTVRPEQGETAVEVSAQGQTRPKTAQEARVSSVASALDAAYAKASMLVLTKEEAAGLSADFPDDAFRLGAGGNPDLLYIEHAYLRERLNTVLGIGAAVPIRRREWAESFTYTNKYNKESEAVRLYVDLVLLVRGAVVGEAIGDAVYYLDNPATNYSDALESAKSAAMRRCCKEFGVGLQAWKKGWAEGWKQRNRGGHAPAAQATAQKPIQPPQERPATPPPPSSPTPPPAKAKQTAPARQEAPPERQERPASTATLPDDEAIVILDKCYGKPTKSGGTRYSCKGKDGQYYATFDTKKFGPFLEQVGGTPTEVWVKFKQTQYGRDIVDIALQGRDTSGNTDDVPRETEEDIPF